MTMTRVVTTFVLPAVLGLGACRQGVPDDQRTDTVTPRTVEQARADWPAGLSAVIDSANAAYSAGDYETASGLYRRATQIGPDVTAGWFGIYMAEHARGNAAAADSAMRQARVLSPDASLLHGTPDDALPPGHP